MGNNFSTETENEIGIIIPKEDFQNLVRDGHITFEETMTINQKWIPGDKRYSMRVRKTDNGDSVLFEHTVKHHIKRGVSLECTTELKPKDFATLWNMYKDGVVENKRRSKIRVQGIPVKNYRVIADFIEGKEDTIRVEIEKIKESVEGFVIPECLKPYVE